VNTVNHQPGSKCQESARSDKIASRFWGPDSPLPLVSDTPTSEIVWAKYKCFRPILSCLACVSNSKHSKSLVVVSQGRGAPQ